MSNDVQSFVSGTPRLILRLEGFCLLAGSLWAFQAQHAGWALFAALFFAPDLSMLGIWSIPGLARLPTMRYIRRQCTARWRRMAISRVPQSRLQWGLSDSRISAS